MSAPAVSELSEPTTSGTDATVHASVAHADKRAARIVARGLRKEAQARAAADKRRAEQAAARDEEHARAQRATAEAKARNARRAAWWAAAAEVAHRVGRLVAVARREAAAVYAMGVYGVAVYVAASSQTQVFHEQLQWAWPRAVGAAAFIEGTSLAFALTAHALRLEGELARICRTLTWAAALFGAGFNYLAHAFDPALPWWLGQLQGVAVGVSSLVGIILWEVRSSARSRKALRKAEKKALPKAQLGVDFWIRYPRRAYWAWSAMVDNPRVRTWEDAINHGRRLSDEYEARRARAQARREAATSNKVFLAAAKKAAKRAAKRGEPGPALSYLGLLAQQGPSALATRRELGTAPEGGAISEPQPEHPAGAPDPGPTCGRGCKCMQAESDLFDALQALTGQLAALTGEGRWPTTGHIAGLVNTPEQDWHQRLDELDAAYRDEDGAEIPLPGRRSVIAQMAERRDRNRFAWTSHSIVDQAIHDLRTRREPVAVPGT